MATIGLGFLIGLGGLGALFLVLILVGIGSLVVGAIVNAANSDGTQVRRVRHVTIADRIMFGSLCKDLLETLEEGEKRRRKPSNDC